VARRRCCTCSAGWKRRTPVEKLSVTIAGERRPADEPASDDRVRHVLLVSIDGLHALDVARFVKDHPGSALAELTQHGVTYTNARTPANSDSFPGLLALVTGGSPITHGLFYDVSYDRSIFDPTNTTCAGTPGNMMVFDESIDVYNSANVSQNVIDPAKLPRIKDASGNCVALRTSRDSGCTAMLIRKSLLVY